LLKNQNKNIIIKNKEIEEFQINKFWLFVLYDFTSFHEKNYILSNRVNLASPEKKKLLSGGKIFTVAL